MNSNFTLVLAVIFIIIVASIQYTLNKIFVVLKEIEKELKKTGIYRK